MLFLSTLSLSGDSTVITDAKAFVFLDIPLERTQETLQFLKEKLKEHSHVQYMNGTRGSGGYMYCIHQYECDEASWEQCGAWRKAMIEALQAFCQQFGVTESFGFKILQQEEHGVVPPSLQADPVAVTV